MMIKNIRRGAGVPEIFFVIILIAAGWVFAARARAETSYPEKLCFGEECFKLELALTEQDKSRGLMNRERMPEDAGMLFVYRHPDRRSFWMKNMSFSIDILWLDAFWQIVDAAEEVPPCDYDPCAVYAPKNPAVYVLELPPGTYSRLNMKLMDRFRPVFSEGDLDEPN